METFLSAVNMLIDPWTLFSLLVGAVIGIVLGVLPGLGPAIAIALALPLTINMELGPSIALLLALYCTSIYGGCVPAILINIPGTPASAATALDGYKLAMQGRAGEALTLVTLASAIGGLVSVVILMTMAPVLAGIALRFGPLELFMVGIFAMTCIVLLQRDIFIRALIAGALGIIIASIGQDPVGGGMRLTFGYFPLAGGIALVPLLIGLFAISEVIIRFAEPQSQASVPQRSLGVQWPTMAYWRHGGPLMLKSSLIGTVMGVLPGAGPTASAFVAYAEAKRTSKDPASFGKGNPDGIVAPETANNAVTGGSLVPTLSLGVPGDAITALILAGLVLQGVVPGPRLYIDNYDLVQFILLTLLLTNILIVVLGLAGLRLWTRVLVIPDSLLVGGIVVLATVGTYTTNNSTFDLVIMVAAGVLGAFMRLAKLPVTPLIIGFVLAPMLEVNLRQALVVYQGNWTIFADRPIAGLLLLMTLTVIVYPYLLKAAGGLRKRLSRI